MSFAVWGIGDWVGGWGGGKTAIVVDDIGVSIRKLDTELKNEITTRSRMYGQEVDPIIRAGLLEQIIQRISSNILLELSNRDLGVTVSDAYIAEKIKNSSEFLDEKGEFNKNRFIQILSHNGFSEADFINMVKSDIVRSTITNTIVNGLNTPKIMSEAIHKYRAEKRVIDAAYVKFNKIKLTKTPTDKDLENTYNESKEMFMTPEYRTISVIQILPKHVKNEVDPNDKDQVYEAMHKLSTELDDSLASGIPYKEASDNLGLAYTSLTADKNKNKPNGKKINSRILTSELMQSAFSLGEGEESPMIEIKNGGFQIIKVESITSPSPRPLKEVKNKVLSTWKQNEREKKAFEEAEQILTNVKKGTSVSTAAMKKGYPYKSSVEVSRFETRKLPAQLVPQMFAIKTGDSMSVKINDGYVVGKLKTVKSPPLESYKRAIRNMKQDLMGSTAGNLLEQYLSAQKDKYGVKINRKVIDSFFAADEN
jgi:peptidyl-prolyl cis-trans isomerase D